MPDSEQPVHKQAQGYCAGPSPRQSPQSGAVPAQALQPPPRPALLPRRSPWRWFLLRAAGGSLPAAPPTASPS